MCSIAMRHSVKYARKKRCLWKSYFAIHSVVFCCIIAHNDVGICCGPCPICTFVCVHNGMPLYTPQFKFLALILSADQTWRQLIACAGELVHARLRSSRHRAQPASATSVVDVHTTHAQIAAIGCASSALCLRRQPLLHIRRSPSDRFHF